MNFVPEATDAYTGTPPSSTHGCYSRQIKIEELGTHGGEDILEGYGWRTRGVRGKTRELAGREPRLRAREFGGGKPPARRLQNAGLAALRSTGLLRRLLTSSLPAPEGL